MRPVVSALLSVSCLLSPCLLSLPVLAQNETSLKKDSELHNLWRLTPAGTHQRIADMPLGYSLSPDGRLLAFVNAGYNAHHLYVADALTGIIQQTLPLDAAWNGIAWSPDGKTLYVSGGGLPKIHVFTRQGDRLQPGNPIALPGIKGDAERQKGEPQAYVSGIAVSPDGKTLYVGNLATDTVYSVSLPDGTVKVQHTLDSNAHPYCLRVGPDGNLYVTEGALAAIAVLKTDGLSQVQRITTDKHPNDLAFTKDGRLFVSCANSDTVLSIDVSTGLIRERIFVTLTQKSPAGAIPSAVELSADGKSLYVANSGNNAVAVVDISQPNQSVVKGFIPTGWFPTMVFAGTPGKLLIGTGKGMGAGPNAGKRFVSSLEREGTDDDKNPKRQFVYVGKLLFGLLSTLDTPREPQLASYTKQVYANTPYTDAVIEHPTQAPKPGSNPIPSRLGDSSPIKHVLYIIKENRTYDQVLGDLKDVQGRPRGNGDPDLTLFGEEITPNIHQLAREFVTLDNTYCSGDVSGNGHPWSTGAIGTDIGERAWMLSYGGHASWPLTDLDIFPPVGRIWDVVERAGLPFASYYFTWTTPNTERNMPVAWHKDFWDRRDTINGDIFAAEVKRYEQLGKMPRFMIMTLREDHTHGTSPGAYTSRSCVASNDQGVGKVIQALSHSQFWKDTAVFIIEDDAQDGPDHVEAHRTTSLVVSPYTRTGKVDSTHYTTVSLLRTMELILGLPPMTQYDAAAPPMYNAFTNRADLTPYVLRPSTFDISEKNTALAYGAADCEKMDFSRPDQLTAVQVDQLNRALWHSIKGPDVPYPAVSRRARIAPNGKAAPIVRDDDD